MIFIFKPVWRKHQRNVCLYAAITFVVFCSTGCSTNQKADEAIISGHIQFPKSNKIYFFSYPDSVSLYLANPLKMDSATVDDNGNYSLHVKCKNGLPFNLMNGENALVINFFIRPGDQLTLNFIGKDCEPELFPSGDAARYDLYLKMFLDTFYKEPSTKQQYYIATNYMTVEDFVTYCERRKQKQLDFYNAFFKSKKPDAAFQYYALNTIEYGIGVDRLMYLWKKRMKGEHIVVDSSYFNFETQDFIENKEAFSCPSYFRFLNLYIKDTYERKVERGELPHDAETLVPQAEKFKLAMRLLRKPFRDVVLYNILLTDLNNGLMPEGGSHVTTSSLDSLTAVFIKKYSLESLHPN